MKGRLGTLIFLAAIIACATALAGCDPNAYVTDELVPTGEPAETLECDSGANACASSSQKRCKHNLDNHYRGHAFTGQVIVEAHVRTQWCYRGGHILSRHSDPSTYVTDTGNFFGWVSDGIKPVRSDCNTSKTTCLTWYQVGMHNNRVPSAPHIGACIQTRINGDGSHNRRIDRATC